ncbi:MAG: GNAT family N-acetyltransferase [Ruminococcaceae bacterium]|nr:GNAT family N-acetyltransferase [Oscillospiraceae bacterium]
MTEYTVRRFQNGDAVEISELIIRTLRTSNIKDYSAEYIENDVKMFTPESVVQRASWTHFYVVLHSKKIVGCGAIGPYWGKEDESSLFNIFVLPEYQGKGVGKRIMETLEQDEFFLKAKRIEIPSSITACEFYKKFGYTYKNGVTVPDEEGLFRLEKRRGGLYDEPKK